jgi:acetyl esterase/lipase
MMFMKQNLRVPLADPTMMFVSGVTFATVPYWAWGLPNRDLKLDFLAPASPASPEPVKRPLLLWLCGGAWLTMDRSAHMPWLLGFAEQGYAVASAEYRMSNCAHFPSQLEDVKKAIRFLRAQAGTYGIDPEKIVVAGESAGGYLAVMAGVTGADKRFDAGDHLEQSSEVAAVIDFYGPVDFAHFKETGAAPSDVPSPVDLLLGYSPWARPQQAAEASALTYLSQGTPPVCILHGTEDDVVPISQSEILHEKLLAAGVRADFYALEGAGHATPHFFQKAVREKILGFLREVCI